MDRFNATILSTIIITIIICGSVIPFSHIFALEDLIDSGAQQVLSTSIGNNILSSDKVQSEPEKSSDTNLAQNSEKVSPSSAFKSLSASSSDNKPPSKVKGLSVKAVSGTEIKLKWSANKDSDFDHYNVYRGVKSSFKVNTDATPPSGTTTTTSYSSTGLSPSTKYYYRVAAVDISGNIGPLTSAKSAKTKTSGDGGGSNNNGPKQVTGLTVTSVSSTEIKLKWSENKESNIDHYNVYLSTKPSFTTLSGSTAPSGTSNTNSYQSSGLSASTTYYYKVAAVDKSGKIGPASSTKSGKTKAGGNSDKTAPAQVAGLSVSTASTTQLNLAWNQNTESDLNHYNVYRGTSSGFSVTLGKTSPLATSVANSYSNSGLNPSTKYYYKVAAVDNAGNIGSLSSEKSGTTASPAPPTPPPDTTSPSQVTGLSVSTASTTQLNLAWTANSESDLNRYNVYRGTTSGFTVNPGVTAPSGTSNTNSYQSTGLSASTTYYYKVAAVDDAGNIGPLSSEKSGTTSGSSSSNMYDDFEGGTYSISDGQKSPNGKWLNRYTSYGGMGVKTENGNNIFYEYPKSSTQSGETHSSLALSTQKFSDAVIELDMRTDKQLRQNSPPNTWESAWVMWRFVDDFHHYYFVLKTNGIEFGKKDTACHCEEQVFLKTGSSPKLQIGSWAHLKISSVGKHTSIWVNGVQVVDMDDPSYSSTGDMSSGAVGLYNEDASVAFDKVSISPQ